MEGQGPAGYPGHGLFGQVVAGGPQSPGGDEDVAAAESLPDRLFQPAGVIPNGGAVEHVNADGGQFPGHNGGVGVHCVAQQQLGSYR